MAKAHIKNKDGTSILIEGSVSEVAELIRKIKGVETKIPKISTKSSKLKGKKRERTTMSDLIESFIDGGFFKKPKDLATIKVALAENGHIYPVTTISPILLRLVRKRHLRRIKENKRWLYTN